MGVIGIDLAGKTKNPTGFATLSNHAAKAFHLFKNAEVIDEVEKNPPTLIAIDAPLTLPAGRCCLNDDCVCRQKGENIREVDKEMIRMGYRVFPPGFGGMKKLTMRGIQLKKTLEKQGYDIIEVHPRSAQDILGFGGRETSKIRRGLAKLNITCESAEMSLHELDAITSAFVAFLHLQNKTYVVGDPEKGGIVIPDPKLAPVQFRI